MREKGKNSAIAIKDPRDVKRVCSDLKSRNEKAYILFMLGLTTGYRGGDLVQLTIGDIREAIKVSKLTVLEEKTENTRKIKFKRTVFLSDKLIKLLKDFISDKDDAEYIYWSQKGSGEGKFRKPIGRGSLGRVFKDSTTRLGIANISVGTHTPRKTYGYNQYIEHGKDINIVQELFGHSTPKVTRDYIGIDEDTAKDSSTTMDKFIP
ncbi:MAG: tyrosine-type recombinase/integrase [Clostridium sp.]